MYDSLLSSILWYLSWPLLIFIAYQAVRLALKHFDKKITDQ